MRVQLSKLKIGMQGLALLAELALCVCTPLCFANAQAGQSAKHVQKDGDRGPVLANRQVDLGHPYRVKHALLVGIDSYPGLTPPWSDLSYAVKDAEALRDVLVQQYGYDERNVHLLTDANATKDKIQKWINYLVNTSNVKEDDCVLVFFAGHGQAVQVQRGPSMGFIIPSDAKDLLDNTNPGPYLDTCLDMETVFSTFQRGPARNVLLMADVCFSGYFSKPRDPTAAAPVVPLPETARLFLTLTAMQVITAGTSTQRAAEKGKYGHGAFTKELLEQLKARARLGTYFTVEMLGSDLQRAVSDITHAQQLPQVGKSDESQGQFLFFPVGGRISGPTVDVSEPEDGISVVSPKLEVHLRVSDSVGIASATLLVNGKPVPFTKPGLEMANGVWERKEVVNLVAGENSIVISVLNDNGETTRLSRTIRYLAN